MAAILAGRIADRVPGARLWRRRVAVSLDPARWWRDGEGAQDRQRNHRRAGVESRRQGLVLYRPRRPRRMGEPATTGSSFRPMAAPSSRPGRCGGWRRPDSGSDAISASPADGLLFTDGDYDSTNIYRMPFDAAFRKASGDPVPVIVGAGFNFSPRASQDGRRIAFAIGNNLSTNIWRAPVDPNTGKVAGEPVRVTSGLDPSRTPSPSRDGARLAYLGGPSKAPEVRIRDLAHRKGPASG